MKIAQLCDINAAISAQYITQCNERFMQQLQCVAQDIARQADARPLVLISGPSGSGKTTTARLLEGLLDAAGYESHTLSMDDYFDTLTTTEGVDLESPERVNAQLLSSQLEDILNCRTVELPQFDFAASVSRPSGRLLTRRKNELIILEGIHALNPEVVRLPDSLSERVYISVRTRLVLPDGSVLHPERIRLARRMLRDRTHRNRPIEGTLQMYEHVQRGEEQFIMPYKWRATHSIDTFFDYEPGVYRGLLCGERLLPPDIAAALSAAKPVQSDWIGQNSLIREFI